MNKDDSVHMHAPPFLDGAPILLLITPPIFRRSVRFILIHLPPKKKRLPHPLPVSPFVVTIYLQG